MSSWWRCMRSWPIWARRQLPGSDFDDPPYRWRSIPIVDPERWLDPTSSAASRTSTSYRFCSFSPGFLYGRAWREAGAAYSCAIAFCEIGIPFALTVGLLMPLAHYPVYRVTAVDPSLAAYWQHWRALPFWPSGAALVPVGVADFRSRRRGALPVGRISADVLGRTVGRLGTHPSVCRHPAVGFRTCLRSAGTCVQPVGLGSHRAVLLPVLPAIALSRLFPCWCRRRRLWKSIAACLRRADGW